MRTLRSLLLAFAWLMMALPGLVALAPKDWPLIGPLRAALEAPPLVGHGEQSPTKLRINLAAWADGRLQRGLSAALDRALPGRVLTVRAVSQVYYDLFARGFAPTTYAHVGRGGSLHQGEYIRAYCNRVRPWNTELVARLSQQLPPIDAALKQRGVAFVVLITPSKVAVEPQSLRATICRHDPAIDALRPALVQALQESGVTVLDAAALARQMTAEDPLPPFPHGGVHWSRLMQQRVASRLLALLGQASGRDLGSIDLGEVDWNAPPDQGERDMLDLLNLLRPPLDYRVGRQALACQATGDGSQARLILVGTSFAEGLQAVLQDCGLFSETRFYWYYVGGVRALRPGTAPGLPYAPVEVGPALWQEELAGRSLLVLEIHEISLVVGAEYLNLISADLARALGL